MYYNIVIQKKNPKCFHLGQNYNPGARTDCRERRKTQLQQHTNNHASNKAIMGWPKTMNNNTASHPISSAIMPISYTSPLPLPSNATGNSYASQQP